MYWFLKKLHRQPITIAFYVSSKFYSYGGGVIPYDDIATCPMANNTSDTRVNHAVLAVGYRYSRFGKSYILFKNSWGSTWGENGYFRMELKNEYTTPGTCNSLLYSRFTLYPTL